MDEKWAARLQQRYAVDHLKYRDGQVYMRVLSQEPPVADAKACEPGLEDVYLFYMMIPEAKDPT